MIVRLALERVRQRQGQEGIDIFGKEKAEQEAQQERDDRNDQPLAQFDEMIEQRRLGRLDRGFVVVADRGHDSGFAGSVSAGSGAPVTGAGNSPAGSDVMSDGRIDWCTVSRMSASGRCSRSELISLRNSSSSAWRDISSKLLRNWSAMARAL